MRRARHAGRRHPPPARTRAQPLPPGFSELGGAGDLDRFLPDSDFVVICCQWTPETTRLFNESRFAAMKAGQRAGQRRPRRDRRRGGPRRCACTATICAASRSMSMSASSSARRWRELWSDPRVLITPHISGASDEERHGAIDHLLRQSARLSRRPAAAQRHRLGTGLLKAAVQRNARYTVFIWVRSYPTVSGVPLTSGSMPLNCSVILVKFSDIDSVGMSPPLLSE